jgi:hypothetical protein
VNATASRSVQNAQKAQQKKNIMILLTGLNYSVFRVGYAITLIQRFFFPKASSDSWNCFNLVAYWLALVSSIDPFFFYYFFNSHFKKFAHDNLKFVFSRCMPAVLRKPSAKERALDNRSSSMAATTTF